MKRQISVSIFLAILVIVLAWLYIKLSNETSPKERELTTENEIRKEPSVVISQPEEKQGFYLKVEDGIIVVYQCKNHNKYMDTSIRYAVLSKEIKERLIQGIFFETEQELYDFLESYSS